jgi:hypothetical protein
MEPDRQSFIYEASESVMTFVYDDGGRKTAGFSGPAGDCVARAVAIASRRPYLEVYERLAEINQAFRGRRRRKSAKGVRTAAHGIPMSVAFKRYMGELGFTWVPTMFIGQGCKIHLHEGELPAGRLVVSVSRHLTAVIDGTIRDTHDPRREITVIGPRILVDERGQRRNEVLGVQRRCVYGYWVLGEAT